MKYSDNTIVQKFIEQLVDALKYKIKNHMMKSLIFHF